MVTRELRAETHCTIRKKIARGSLDLDPRRPKKMYGWPQLKDLTLRTQRKWHCEGIYASKTRSEGTEAELRNQDSRIWKRMERSASSPSPPTGETWDGPIPVRSSLNVNYWRREEDSTIGVALTFRRSWTSRARPVITPWPPAVRSRAWGSRLSTCETGRKRGILIPFDEKGHGRFAGYNLQSSLRDGPTNTYWYNDNWDPLTQATLKA
jgi:hypothetical protein